MEVKDKPKISLARTVLNKELFNAIKLIFSNDIEDLVLVGGTALSGFYFGHRVSDDIDLFVKHEKAFKACETAIKQLKENAVFSNEYRTKSYYNGLCSFDNYQFTIDLVLDENLFKLARSYETGGINVLDLQGLFMTKAATLVSRASEKDLYDLLYLTKFYADESIKTILDLGAKVDSGMVAESLLVSLGSANLNKNSCNFSLKEENKEKVFKDINDFKKRLIKKTIEFLESMDSPKEKTLFCKIKSFDK